MRRTRGINPPQVLNKHIPQRTRVACRKVTDKRELIRLVRTADGGVEVDLSGKKAGRGAYLCQTPECWESGLNRGRLEHALRTTLVEADRRRLASYGEELMLGVRGGKSG